MILKNGKRLDGCSDTVPIGTLNPFLGTTAPYGYLICQGQKVSKTTYKELYEICGDIFGQSTDTEFYLPDLRRQTIAGYKEGDSTFGNLGGLIGNLTHSHNTGNHTLTIEEMPEHTHHLMRGGQTWIASNGAYAGVLGDWGEYDTGSTGGSHPHNHGDTSSTSSVQPTIILNWIVKAFQLMPNQSYVSNHRQVSNTNTYSCDYINELKTLILDSAFPVGKVEVFFDNEDHSNYLGFQWERTLQGLTPVGIQSTDEDFATIGKTGGAKTVNLQHTHSYAHTHGVPGVAHVHSTGNHTLTVDEIPSHSHTFQGVNDGTTVQHNFGSYPAKIYQDSSPNWTGQLINYTGGSGAHNHGNTGSTTPDTTTTNSQSTSISSNGGSTTQSIMQPYGVVAYWKRIG